MSDTGGVNDAALASSSTRGTSGTNWGGGALTAASGVVAARAQMKAGDMNARALDMSADYERQRAEQVMEAGGFHANVRELVGTEQESQATARTAGGGAVVGAGTMGNAARDARNLSEMDQLMIQTNARRAAYGMQMTANDLQWRGQLARTGARQGADATLLSTADQEALEMDPSYMGARRSGTI